MVPTPRTFLPTYLLCGTNAVPDTESLPITRLSYLRWPVIRPAIGGKVSIGACNFYSKLHCRGSRENTIVDGGSAVGRRVVDDTRFITEEAAPAAVTV